MDDDLNLAGEARRGQLVLGVLLALLAAVIIVPVFTDAAVDEDADVGALRPLGLVQGGGASAETASLDMAMPAMAPTYVLQGDLSDLGDAAPVYELSAPPLDAARVEQLAAAFGVAGAARAEGDGFVVDSGQGLLEVWPSPAGWQVSTWHAGDGEMIAATTSGSAGGTDPVGDIGASTSSACAAPLPGEPPVPCDDMVGIEVPPPDGYCMEEVAADGTTVETCFDGSDLDVPAVTVPVDPMCAEEEDPDGVVVERCDDLPLLLPPTPEPWPVVEPPEDLPSAGEAEQIARDVLARAGVLDGEWTVDVSDGSVSGFAVACAPGGDCADVVDQVVHSRSVGFTRVLDGLAVAGLTWSVEVGDHGEVTGVWGLLADVERIGDYPLRPIDQAYGALVAGEAGVLGMGPGGPFGGPLPVDLAASSSAGVAVGAPIEPMLVEPPLAIDEGTIVTHTVPCHPDAGPDCTPAVEPFCSVAGGCQEPVPPPAESFCDVAGDCDPVLPACVVDDRGIEICETDGQPFPPDLPPLPDAPVPIEPPFEPAPLVIEVTGAELGLIAVPALREGDETTYVVPSYRFIGTWPGGERWEQDVVAVDDAWLVDPYASTPTAPVPSTTTPVVVSTVPLPTLEPTVTEPPATTEPSPPPPTTEPGPLPPTTSILLPETSLPSTSVPPAPAPTLLGPPLTAP